MKMISLQFKILRTSMLTSIFFWLCLLLNWFYLKNDAFLMVTQILFPLVAGIAVYYTIKKPMQSLDQLARSLAQAGVQIYSATQNLSEASQDLSRSAEEQASSLQASGESIDEISSVVSKNAENALSSLGLVGRGETAALKGKESVDQIIRSIQEINRSTFDIAAQMAANQGEISEVIGMIAEIENKTKVINEFVFQTKLLSFNASVEASRAGEHGKGFSVVASEVGKLAQMSGNASLEISELLGQSTRRVNKTLSESQNKIESMVQATKSKVEAGVQTAQQCHDALEDIVKNVNQVSSLVKDISSASQQQAQGVQGVTLSIKSLDQTSQTNTKAAEKSLQEGRKLAQQGAHLSLLADSLIVTVRGQIQPAMGVQILKERFLKSGDVKIGKSVPVGTTRVHDLFFGGTKVAHNFEILDEMKSDFGGMATVFSRSGEDFIRINTNVMNQDGSRAIGSALAKNKAYEAVMKGQSFRGELEILGALFNACYEPIFIDQKVVGIFYFGFKK